MKISLLALCATLATLSVAEAIPAAAPRTTDLKPRYYFPRAVKRQVDVTPFANTTAATTSTTSDIQTRQDSTDVSGVVDSIVSGASTVVGSVASDVGGSSTASEAPSNTDTGTGPVQAVTTPDATPASASAPSVVNTDTTATPASITPAPTTTADSSGITIGLSGVISSTPDASQVASSIADASSSLASAVNSLESVGATADASQLASVTNALTSLASAASSLAVDASSAISDPSSTQGPITTPADVTTTPTDVATPPTTPATDSPSVAPSNTDLPSASPPIDSGSVTPSVAQPSNTFVGTGNVSPTFSPSVAPSQSPDVTPTVAPSVTPDVTPSPFVPQVANQTSDEITPTFAPSKASAPISIKPTGSDSATALTPASSIVVASSKTGTPASSTSTPSSIPTSLPGVIKPEGGVPDVPDNSTLIQLGFTYGLNYNFVVSSTTAVAQIFSYLPAGVGYGLDINKKEVVMQYLQPYNTLASLQYITTLAMAYIPSDQVDKLSMALLNPSSNLYNNPNPSVKTLMAMIDPSIPLLAGASIAGGTPINSANSAATTSDGANQGDAPGSEGGSSSSPVRPSSVGIAVGAVAGAAVYGAAMFLVARRYKKRKASHQRSSSTLSGGVRRPGESSTLMAGGRNSYGSRYPQQPQNGRGSRNSDRSDGTNRSGRTYISPPVMAENSLGWN